MENRAEGAQALLEVKGVTKRFGGVVAVRHVSLSVRPGEVVGLLGDNGAGKSTLIKIISGVHRPDEGELCFEGKMVHFTSPLEARERGIETIYQDLALCENLNAFQNIFLGREHVRRRFGVLPQLDEGWMFREAQQVLEQLDIRLPNLRMPVRLLSGGQRQAVAIARAIYWKARLMIMDEPTAALGVPEQQKVLELVQTLRERGIPVILISHNLQDVFAIADRVVVMRRGEVAGERLVKETNNNELVGLMVGAVGIG